MADAHDRAPFPDGLHPFWFWNARIEPGEIRWQIEQMAEQGVRGFFLSPRQGLEQPYLSDTWFDLVEVALDAAARHGLTAHLYDDFPYPSGAAGGAVMMGEPRFEATQLTHRSWTVPGGAVRIDLPRGAPLCVVAHPLRDGAVDWSRRVDLLPQVGVTLASRSYRESVGLTQYNRKRFFAQEPTPSLEVDLPAGPHRIFAAVQERITWHKYWGTAVDVLDPDAIEKFLRLTHERYAARLGTGLRAAASIFTDETEPQWSPRLIGAYRAEHGEDLSPLLPALQDGSHPRHLELLDRLWRLRLRLFEESFEGPVSRWCAAHGIRYAGEKPSLRLSQLRWMDIPGCEPGHTKAGAAKHDLLRPHPRQNARATASAAYFYGKEGSLCECYHSLGWSGTLQDAKSIAESLLLMGIRWLVPHAFFYTTHSLAKHDAPPTFFFQMPYWPLFGRLSKRLERIAARFAGTWIDADIAVVDPASGLPTSENFSAYEDLMHALGAAQLDFHVVDTDILEAGELASGSVRLRDVVVRIVVLPPMRMVEPPLAAWLDRFAAGGGQVLRMQHGDDPRATAKRLLALSQPRLRLTALAGSAERVLSVTRRSRDGHCWLLINSGDAAVDLALDAGVELRELPLDELSTPMLRKLDGAWRRTLAPYESALIEEGPTEEAPPPRLVARIGGRCRVMPVDANLVRLGEWELSLPEAGEGSARVAPMPLANQLDQARLRFAPRFEHGFGTTPAVRLPRLRARYACEVMNAYAGAVDLVMEPGSLAGDWSLRVNGSRPFVASDFTATTAHVRGSLGLDVTSLLARGRNRIEIELETERLDGGLLNPLYLAGAFAATVEPIGMAAPRAEGVFEDWEGNGLPWYAGTVDYALAVDLGTPPSSGEVVVDLEFAEPFLDCAEVSFNGGPWRPAPWAPRQVRVPAGELRPGRNELSVRVRTTLIRAFEGQWFDQRAHRYRKVGERAG
jgi:hypothetical protein